MPASVQSHQLAPLHHVNQRLNTSRADLLQKAAAIIAKATTDHHPGYDYPTDLKAVSDALEAYRASESSSDTADADQVGDTTTRDKLIRTINTRRSAIQHAADALWPYTEDTSPAHRKAFHLPANRPLGV